MDDRRFPLILPDDPHPELALWGENVGAAISLDLASPPQAPLPRTLHVLSWNVAIGEGDLAEVVGRAREGSLPGVELDAGVPLVALIQEAFRADRTVPDALRTNFHGGKRVTTPRTDVIDAARALGMSVRYAPSMRNGAHASDRGNAILSTLPITDSAGLKLPHVRQRRVAVTASIPAAHGLVVVSAHLDTRGRPRDVEAPATYDARSPAFGTGRAAQARHLARALVERHGEHDVLLGADLNSPFGRRDPAVRALRDAGFEHADRVGPWRYTMRAPLRLELDHVLLRPGAGRVESVRVHRLDDGDRSIRRCFGSDHHPLLAVVRLTA